MSKYSNKHDFKFEGGGYLTQIGASWFVSYSYYSNIDKNHLAWKKVKTSSSRITIYNLTIKYHEFWLNKVMDMDNNRLSTNKIGLKGYQVKQMAKEILSKINTN